MYQDSKSLKSLHFVSFQINHRKSNLALVHNHMIGKAENLGRVLKLKFW